MVFIPPTFNDIGKSCKDLFSKGFYLGEVKFEHKTKTKTGLELTASGSVPKDSDKVSANVETKYKFKCWNLTMTKKWNLDNTFSTTLDLEDKLLKGLKLTLDGSHNYVSGKNSLKVKGDYKRKALHYNTEIDTLTTALKGGKEPPTAIESLVLGYEGYLLGLSVGFDLANRALSKHSLVLGWKSDDLEVNGSVNEAREVLGQFYQKISPALDWGLQAKWNRAANTSSLQAGFKYNLDHENTVKAYVATDHSLGLSLAHNLRSGVKLTLSSVLNTKALIGGTASAAVPSQRLGLALEFDSA